MEAQILSLMSLNLLKLQFVTLQTPTSHQILLQVQTMEINIGTTIPVT